MPDRSATARRRPWRKAALAGVLVLAGLAALAGAARDEAPARDAAAAPPAPPAWERWGPPPRPPVRLVDLEPGVTATRDGMRAPGAILLLEGKALAERCRHAARGGAKVVTCYDVPASASDAETLELVVRPGAADRVVVTPLATTSATEAIGVVTDRKLRILEVPLDRAASSSAARAVSLPIGEAIRGNWSSSAADTRLVGLEIALHGDENASVERIRLTGAADVLGTNRAIAAAFDVAGSQRPAWIVRPGTTLTFKVAVPKTKPVLRWHAARSGPAGPLVVRLPGWIFSTELDRVRPDGAWRRREVSLERWAGKTITLELAAAPSATREASGLALFGDPEVASRAPSRGSPSVLLYLVDTLRADRIGAYGYGAATTPVMDRLAREGWLFRQAIAPSSWTKPVVVSLMTGHDPLVHRIGARAFTDRLRPGVPLVQDAFRGAGYRTGSFVANPLAGPLSGVGRGFSPAVLPRHWKGRTGRFGHPPAALLHDAFLSWLDEDPHAPFFAWVHTLEVHEYGKPPFTVAGRDISAAYDAAVTAADAELGRLFEALARRGRLDDLVVVLVSDHGESLDEHGVQGHGLSLFQPEIHVPLIAWSPAFREPRSIGGMLSLLELPGGLLDLAGIEAGGPLGESRLLDAARGRAAGAPRVFSSIELFPLLPEAPQKFAVIDAGGRKLFRLEPGGDLHFDLARDPGETRPLGEDEAGLGARLDGWRAESAAAAGRLAAPAHGVGEPPALEPDELERLKSLGYVE